MKKMTYEAYSRELKNLKTKRNIADVLTLVFMFNSIMAIIVGIAYPREGFAGYDLIVVLFIGVSAIIGTLLSVWWSSFSCEMDFEIRKLNRDVEIIDKD